MNVFLLKGGKIMKIVWRFMFCIFWRCFYFHIKKVRLFLSRIWILLQVGLFRPMLGGKMCLISLWILWKEGLLISINCILNTFIGSMGFRMHFSYGFMNVVLLWLIIFVYTMVRRICLFLEFSIGLVNLIWVTRFCSGWFLRNRWIR